MTLLEAYQRTLDVAVELREVGIDVKITPSKSPKQKTDEDPLPKDKWVIIQFFVQDKDQAAAVRKKATELGWAGIVFDTSGHPGEREWAIDWSFDIGATPDGDWEAKGDEVEDMIDGEDSGFEPA